MKQIKYEQCGIGSVLLVALVLSYRRQLLSSYYQNRVFLGVTDFFLGSLFCLFVLFCFCCFFFLHKKWLDFMPGKIEQAG